MHERGKSVYQHLSAVDPEIMDIIDLDIKRQDEKLVMIASENFASLAVLQAMASPLTNKYAEGYPGRRYYHGCEHVDSAEALAIERAKELFKSEHANVQPHSGAQANQAVYFALLKPKDVVLGMDLSHGGHLTHGSPVNMSGSWFKFVHYGVDKETECLDYDQIRELARQHKPKLIVAGASAYPRFIDFKLLREIADEVGAYLMVDMAHIAGLVAAGFIPAPCLMRMWSPLQLTNTAGPQRRHDSFDPQASQENRQGSLSRNPGRAADACDRAKAVAFKEAMTDEFIHYQRQVVKNAKVLADGLIQRGFKLISGGTDNHLILVDVKARGYTGKQAPICLMP